MDSAGLMILVSLDMSFIYASHFARQEILLGISLLSCLFLLLNARVFPPPGSLCTWLRSPAFPWVYIPTAFCVQRSAAL